MSDIFPHNSHSLDEMLAWSKASIQSLPNPLNGAKSLSVLAPKMSHAISPSGIGEKRAFAIFTDVIVPSTRALNHPNALAFIPSSPSPASLGMDMALSAVAIFGSTWESAAGAIHAENQAISWLANCAGFPSTSGGVFVSGGTAGNVSALHAARVAYKETMKTRPNQWRIICSEQTHCSIDVAAGVMDAETIKVPCDSTGRIVMSEARTKAAEHPSGIFAVVANAGATNCGAVDDMNAMADLAKDLGVWLHVDGAYGLAALANPDMRDNFSGIERADSFIVDPHKWLFAPYDSCALIYRDPLRGARAHGKHAPYLDVLDRGTWDPMDYGLHLSRRARGLPFWFSLASYGTEAYARAIQKTCQTAREIAYGIEKTAGLDLVLGPQLTIVLFRPEAMLANVLDEWSEKQKRKGTLLCLPTTWQNEKVLRICVTNPATDSGQVLEVLKTLTKRDTSA